MYARRIATRSLIEVGQPPAEHAPERQHSKNVRRSDDVGRRLLHPGRKTPSALANKTSLTGKESRDGPRSGRRARAAEAVKSSPVSLPSRSRTAGAQAARFPAEYRAAARADRLGPGDEALPVNIQDSLCLVAAVKKMQSLCVNAVGSGPMAVDRRPRPASGCAKNER